MPLLLFVWIVLAIMISPSVSAEIVTCSGGTQIEVAESDSGREQELCALQGQNAQNPNSAPCTAQNLDKNNCGILAYLIDGINLLSALVGIVIVIMIAVGGLQYSASRDNPQSTQAAKEKIRNAILALLAYIFMYAFLQYLIPGGVLNK